MKYFGHYKRILTPLLITIPFVAFAQDSGLSLKHGIYVRGSSSCKGAPNAAILSWNGTGFSGVHSRECISRVIQQDGRQFQINTTCSAMGDGTSATPGYVDSFLLKRLSKTRFKLSKDNQPQGTYRWCSAKSIE